MLESRRGGGVSGVLIIEQGRLQAYACINSCSGDRSAADIVNSAGITAMIAPIMVYLTQRDVAARCAIFLNNITYVLLSAAVIVSRVCCECIQKSINWIL